MIYANQLELAERHVTDLLALLKVVGQRGTRIDTVKLDAFNSWLDEEMAKLQKQFDADPELAAFGGYHPKEGYKKTPKDTTGMVVVEFKLAGSLEWQEPVLRWAKRKPFLATSPLQVQAYMKSKGHSVPRGGTTDAKALLLMWRKYKDDHYRDFVQMRKLRKLRGTYGEWPLQKRLSGWDSGDTAKELTYVTTKFTLRPDTGRLSSVNPNLQNIPKRGPLAKRFRECLVSSPDHRLVRADLASAEAVIIGWLSGDPVLQRLAPLGMHKFAMATKLGVKVDLNKSDEELGKLFDELKHRDEELYNVIKTTVYGSFYLAGPRTLFERNPEDFSSQGDAKKFQEEVYEALPAIRTWQQGMTLKRYTYGRDGRNWGWQGNRLINPFGYSKEFWDMRGSDGPAACAFLPQSTIASVMKESMLQLDKHRYAASEFTVANYMNLQIHDELVFDVPQQWAEASKAEIRGTMGQSWPQLGGLRLGVEIKVSESMA